MIWKHHYAEMKTTNSLLFENSKAKKENEEHLWPCCCDSGMFSSVSTILGLNGNQRKHSTFQDDVNPSNKKKQKNPSNQLSAGLIIGLFRMVCFDPFLLLNWLFLFFSFLFPFKWVVPPIPFFFFLLSSAFQALKGKKQKGGLNPSNSI